jgi:hypothetical protein
MSLEDVAQTNRRPDVARGVLRSQGFESGYRRSWIDPGTRELLVERDYLFGSAFGAGFWLGTIKSGDERGADWRQTYDTASLPNSFGGYRVLADGTYNTVVEFVPGDRVLAVSISSPAGAEEALALEQARQERALVPSEAFSQNGVAGFAKVIGYAAGFLVLVALVAGAIIFFAVGSSRRHTPATARPPAVMYSPDGRWWWDGRQWQPVAGGPPP